MFELEPLVGRAKATPNGYLEFLRQEFMSVGIYVLAAGAEDRQKPHDEDEIYYVVRGKAKFRHGDADLRAEPGDVHYVPAGETHFFHSIESELVLFVVFAPPEGSEIDGAI
jgi:mannose-6-phosphate isomerase-like protein (cupin superfamily)